MEERNSRTPRRNTGDDNDEESDGPEKAERKKKAKALKKKERERKKTQMGDDIDALTKDDKRLEKEFAEAKKQIRETQKDNVLVVETMAD